MSDPDKFKDLNETTQKEFQKDVEGVLQQKLTGDMKRSLGAIFDKYGSDIRKRR